MFEYRNKSKTKSLKLNMLLNILKNLVGLAFPLITFPYISKVLGAENVGKYNFSSSIIMYATLLADLGIATYAIRECSKCRNNKDEVSKLASEIFTINIISTFLSYLLLFISIITVEKFKQYQLIMLILSINIICKTLGTEWIFSVFEDYMFITIRTIIFQFISLVLLLLFVHTKNDLVLYTIITVVSTSGAGIINLIHARKYCQITISLSPNFAKHLYPIIIIFGMSATVTVYVASDTTILGFICGDEPVGIYYVSSRVYGIIKQLLSAVLVVSIPQLSLLWGEKQNENFNALLSEIYKTLLSFSIPVIVGLIAMRKEIVLLLANSEYIRAASSLGLLGIALFFCMGAWFWGQCVLVVTGQEKIIFYITLASALLNIILNIVLIPIWAENAAAFTTVLAEALSFFLCKFHGKKKAELKNINICVLKILFGCLWIILICSIIPRYISGNTKKFLYCISLSSLAYILTEILLKNEAIYNLFFKMITKFKKKRTVS